VTDAAFPSRGVTVMKSKLGAALMGAFLIFAQSGTAAAGTIVIDQNGAQDVNNLRQIGLALHNYNGTFGSFPAEYSSDASGAPLLSWRVALLPFLGPSAAALFNQFHLNEAWNSTNNSLLLQQMPDVYRSPLDPANSIFTRYAGGSGPGTMFPCTGVAGSSCNGLRPNVVFDGTSNTLFVGETEGSNIPWTEPIDIPIGASPTLGGNGFSSFIPGAVPFVFVDGSVLFLPNNIDSNTLHALFTPAGGESVDTSALLVPSVAVPGPIAGAGLPGLILACGGLLGWWRRRRKIA